MCVCVREIDRERVRERNNSVTVSVYVCVYVRERKRGIERERYVIERVEKTTVTLSIVLLSV